MHNAEGQEILALAVISIVWFGKVLGGGRGGHVGQVCERFGFATIEFRDGAPAKKEEKKGM